MSSITKSLTFLTNFASLKWHNYLQHFSIKQFNYHRKSFKANWKQNSKSSLMIQLDEWELDLLLLPEISIRMNRQQNPWFSTISKYFWTQHITLIIYHYHYLNNQCRLLSFHLNCLKYSEWECTLLFINKCTLTRAQVISKRVIAFIIHT